MEEIIARIKEYVEILYPDMAESLELEEAYIDFMVRDVVDRALTITNRFQLVEAYEEALELLEVDGVLDNDIALPIPAQLERPLAQTVVAVIKNGKAALDGEKNDIQTIKDNGQEVTYKDSITEFLSSSNDSEIFSNVSGLLKRYILPNVIASTKRLYNTDSRYFLRQGS